MKPLFFLIALMSIVILSIPAPVEAAYSAPTTYHPGHKLYGSFWNFMNDSTPGVQFGSLANIWRVNRIWFTEPGNASDIQAKIDGATAGDTIWITAGTYDLTGLSVISLSKGLTIKSDSGALINGTNLIKFSDINYPYPVQLPALQTYAGTAIELNGTDLAEIYVSQVNCMYSAALNGTAVLFNGSEKGLLDSTVRFTQIANCNKAIEFKASGDTTTLQGNVVDGNFVTTSMYAAYYNNISGYGGNPAWDGNRVTLQAYDPTTSLANGTGLFSNGYLVRNVFEVDGWMGGFATYGKYWNVSSADSMSIRIMLAESYTTDKLSYSSLGKWSKVEWLNFGTFWASSYDDDGTKSGFLCVYANNTIYLNTSFSCLEPPS